MQPEAFSLSIPLIGDLHIRWYGIMAAAGLLAGTLLMQYKKKHAGLSANQISDMVLWTVICGIIGARIFYIIEFWQLYKNNLFEIIRIDKGGIVFYGGFIGGFIFLYSYCKHKKLNFLKVTDVFAPGMSLGHAFGRIGCFLNGCCFGCPGNLPWCIIYPLTSDPSRKYPGIPLHPVQLYESAGNFIITGILLFMMQRLKPGQTAALYIILYGILRFFDEFFRGDNIYFFLNTFSPGQTVAMLVVPVAIIWFIYLQKNKYHDSSRTANNMNYEL